MLAGWMNGWRLTRSGVMHIYAIRPIRSMCYCPPHPPTHTHYHHPHHIIYKHINRLAEFLPFLHEQFAYVGPGRVGGEQDAPSPNGDPFFQETPDSFTLWCSGRRHVQGGMAVSLHLRPRHDGIKKMWEFLLPTEVRELDVCLEGV